MRFTEKWFLQQQEPFFLCMKATTFDVNIRLTWRPMLKCASILMLAHQHKKSRMTTILMLNRISAQEPYQ